MEIEKVNDDQLRSFVKGSIGPPIEKFGNMRGALPEQYTPAWKKSINFRQQNICLAEEYGVNYSTHGDDEFLGKRQRFEPTIQNTPTTQIERVASFPLHSHMSKYNSSHLHRRKY